MTNIISSLDVHTNSNSSDSNTLNHIENSNPLKNVTTLNVTTIDLIRDLEVGLNETARNTSLSLNETNIAESNETTSFNSTHNASLNSLEPRVALVSNVFETSLDHNKTLNNFEPSFKPNVTETVFKPLPNESTFDPNLILRRNVTGRSSNLGARRNWTESRAIFNSSSHLYNNRRETTPRLNSFITDSELIPVVEYTSDDSVTISSTSALEFESTRRSRTSPSRASTRLNEARRISLNRPARRTNSYESRLRSWLDPNIVAIRYNPNLDRSNRPSRVPSFSSTSFITSSTRRPSTRAETFTPHSILAANYSFNELNENLTLNLVTESNILNFDSTTSSPPPTNENRMSVLSIADEVNDV